MYRGISLKALIRINEDGALSHLVIREALAQANHLTPRDKALVKRLTEGTLERQIQIDYLINHFSQVPVLKMKPLIRNLLRMSIYQIIFMDSIPDHASCDEAVKLCIKYKFTQLKGFVNGILRNIIRNKDNLPLPDENENLSLYLSVFHSMPEWLVNKWLAEYGIPDTQKILSGMLEVKPITIRYQQQRQIKTKEAWLESLRAAGIEMTSHPYLNYAYELSKVADISTLPGFQDGLFMVQDISSMLVCEAAVINRNDTVIDVCAAPGGKATHAASLAKRVIARDISLSKCELIKENAGRLKQQNIDIAAHDATIPDETLFGKADVLLADLPCSGLGVISKKPDIKHKTSPQGINDLIALQKRILGTVWQYVKPDGILIYSTCTLNRDENEEMVTWFTGNFPFTIAPLPDLFTRITPYPGDVNSGMLKLLPGIHQSDGFFLCRLRRSPIG